MSILEETRTDPDDRVDRAVAEYHAAVDRGEIPTAADWIARHPDIARELEAYFADLAAEGWLGRPPGWTPAIGSRIGDYVLLERLGGGGEGTVYKARHRLHDEMIVALKLVTDGSERGRGIREEVRSLARLRHANIVPIHSPGEDRGIWYYTMPLMEGGSLEDHVSEFRDDPRRAARLIERVARGMHHAHARGIMHFDLKPANVLLGEDGDPRVSDFGLAKRILGPDGADPEPPRTRGLAAGDADSVRWCVLLSRPQIRGTAPYMSPEMASGEAAVVTTAADVYGLGAILFALLTGRPPFRGATLGETLRMVVGDPPAPPRDENPRVDRELQAVCLKCLEKDPSDRYGSADALANDLARWLRREPTLAGRPTIGKHLRSWLLRHPGRVAAAVLAALVLWLVGLAGSLGEIHTANRREARRLAREVRAQLRMIEYAVEDVARDPDLRDLMRAHPGPSPGRRTDLDDFLGGVSRTFNERFGIAGGSPLINVFILDDRGVLIADTFTSSPSVGMDFHLRDYWRTFVDPDHPRPREAVAVSRAFRSVKDSLFKIAVATRIWDDDRGLGVLVANVAIGPGLVMLDMAEESEGASVVGPMDWTYADRGPPPPPGPPTHLAVLHRSYEKAAASPIWADPVRFPRLAEFDRDARLAEATDRLRIGAVTDYCRVGETPLVAVLRRPYPGAAGALLDARVGPWALAAPAVLASLLLVRAARRSAARPREDQP